MTGSLSQTRGRPEPERCLACGHRIWRDLQYKPFSIARRVFFWRHVPPYVSATCAACGATEYFIGGSICVRELTHLSNSWEIYETGDAALSPADDGGAR